MSREEIISSHKEMTELVDRLEHQGDFDAHAASIRTMAKVVLVLMEEIIDWHRA